MRWHVFAILALIALIFETGLIDAIHIQNVKPSVCAALATFVALSAPRITALWSCLILGLLLDLSSDLSLDANETLHLIGPHTLGYVAGGLLVLQVRTTVFRRRPLAIGAMTILFALTASTVVMTIYTVRSWYPDGLPYWADTTLLGEIVCRFFAAIYSGLFGVPLGWMFVRLMPLWQFHSGTIRGGGVAWR